MNTEDRENLIARVGLVFAVVVTVMLAGGIASPQKVPLLNPSVGDPRTGTPQLPFMLCTGPSAPPISSNEFQRALDWWAEQGDGYVVPRVVEGPCPDVCSFVDRQMGCRRGYTAVRLQDGGFDPDHLGEVFVGPHARVITLPSSLSKMRARDRHRVVLHEVGHGFNLDHVTAFWGLLSPGGHIMSEDYETLGKETDDL